MWLCIDQGGHSTRAAVLDDSGRIVALQSAPLETVTREPCFVEHDPAALLESVRRCVAGIARELGRSVSHLESAGIATQRSTLVCASRATGAALTPLISWQDRRGQDDIERFDGHAERIKAITGLLLTPHYGMAKLRWCLQHVDAVRRHLAEEDLIGAPLASFLLHHLCRTDQWCVDPVNASRTLLMDMRTIEWSDELLALFELPRGLLPAIQPCRSSFGMLDVGGHAVPLTVATGDQSAALYCLGDPAAGTAFINIGTGAFVQAITGPLPVTDRALLSSIVWQDDEARAYVLEGTVNGAASAVDAVAAELGVRLAPAAPELERALDGIERAPLYLNGISGLGSPDWVADFSSRFEGRGSAAERLAAVYESVVFLIVRNLERMRKHLRLSRVTISGGLAQSDWIAQSLANLSGLPVTRPAEPEATLMGLGYLVSEGRMLPSDGGRHFDPLANAVAEGRYRDWTVAMEAELRA